MLKPGQRVELEPPANLIITGASLGAKLSDKGRTSVVMRYLALDAEGEDASDNDDDEEDEDKPDTNVVLCSLTPDKVRARFLS